MRRRAFIAGLGGAAAWPVVARSQQSDRIRRIATLTGVANEEGGQERITIFVQTLAQLGWIVCRNAWIESRWGGGDAGMIRKHATELVALGPDVIMATGGAAVGRLLQITRTVPIVFTIAPDPVGSGFVNSLSRPGGNATGFVQFDTVWPANGWICSRRSCQPQRGQRLFGIPRKLQRSGSTPSFRP